MDRFRRVWNETHRPPPLRTTSTYDDDEAFQGTAKQILARVNALSSSPRDAIYNVLVSSNQRACFWEGLNQRKDHPHLPAAMAILVQELEDASVGKLLKDICTNESASCCIPTRPKTPRCDNTSSNNNNNNNNNNNSNNSYEQQPKKCPARRFFPADFVVEGSNVFFRKTRRVQNIDWKLCAAVQAVDNLRLIDGHHHQQQQVQHQPQNDHPMDHAGS